MKKILFAGVVIFLLAISGIFAFAKQPKEAFSIPKHAVKINNDTYDLGEAVVNGETLHGYMFIKYKKEFFQKPANNGARTGKSTCYSFLSSGARWKNTESYVLDTSNADGMPDSFVDIVTSNSLDSWDSQVAFEIFGNRNFSATVDGIDASSPDNKNEIMFGDVSTQNVIAVTTVWGIFGGPTQGRKIVEFDALFDDIDFSWGDATSSPSLMDYQNIATHELGHAAGMGHPLNTCTEETMYAYAAEGETKKRTLNTGDISGIKSLYK